jgi:hypothetical protein
MKLYLVILLPLLMALTAWAGNVDKDGVPKVDIHGEIVVVKPAGISNGFHFPAQRVRMISINGKKIPLKEFLLTYCPGKSQNETCARGSSIQGIDFASGPVEKLPKGL